MTARRSKHSDHGSEQEVEFLRERVRELESRLGKHLEAARIWQASERRYQDLVEHAQDLVWQLDPTGRILYINPVWEKLSGYTLGESLGHLFTEFQDADAAARDMQTLASLLAGPGEVLRGYETVFRRKSGLPLHFLVNASVVRDAEGRITGAYGTSTDITERRLAERTEAERTGRIIRFQEALLQLAQREMDNLPNSLAAVARTAARALLVDRVSVWRFSPDRSELVSEILHDEVPGRAEGQDRLVVSRFPAYFEAVEKQRAIAVADVRIDPRVRDFLDVYSRARGSGRAWMFRSGASSGWRESSASSMWAARARGIRRRSTSRCPSPTRWPSSWRRTSAAGRRTSSGPSSGRSSRAPAWSPSRTPRGGSNT